MTDIAIRVENLSKEFSIGRARNAAPTLREVITDSFKAPFRKTARLLKGDASGASELDRRIWALKDINFEVRQGEVVGLIGRNGAGKSTLLKILSRITHPTEGGADVYGRVGSLLEVGTGFHPELTGRENIYLNAAILGMRKVERDGKFDEIVAFSEIGDFLDTPVKHYSSGMYVRLAFAVAASLEPDILFVDEVLAVGDKAFQDKCLAKMGNRAQSGRTVLFVSHNMAAISALCGRCILLDKGRALMDGPTEEVVQTYLSYGSQMSGRIEWDNEESPRNRSLKLVSVTLLNSEMISSSTVYISENIHVQIEYEIIRNGACAMFSLVLYDAGANCLFGSLSNLEENYHGKPLRLGRYVSTCTIHKDLLNNGRYYISIIGCTDYWQEGFRADHCISFEALEDGKLKGDFPQNFGGSLRPRLHWETRPA
jgi:lipopolysaccharide transport system ATP-binding protein